MMKYTVLALLFASADAFGAFGGPKATAKKAARAAVSAEGDLVPIVLCSLVLLTRGGTSLVVVFVVVDFGCRC